MYVIYIYIYTHICVYVCIYIYIYTYVMLIGCEASQTRRPPKGGSEKRVTQQ